METDRWAVEDLSQEYPFSLDSHTLLEDKNFLGMVSLRSEVLYLKRMLREGLSGTPNQKIQEMARRIGMPARFLPGLDVERKRSFGLWDHTALVAMWKTLPNAYILDHPPDAFGISASDYQMLEEYAYELMGPRMDKHNRDNPPPLLLQGIPNYNTAAHATGDFWNQLIDEGIYSSAVWLPGGMFDHGMIVLGGFAACPPLLPNQSVSMRALPRRSPVTEYNIAANRRIELLRSRPSLYTDFLPRLQREGRLYLAGYHSTTVPHEITLRYVEGMPRNEFIRKALALQGLGEQGLLIRGTTPRNPEVTKAFRRSMIDRIWVQYGQRNPEFANRLIIRVTRRMSPDHVHELQLGGPDSSSNLRWLDRFTNEQIGMQQVWPQIRSLPEGTSIRILIIIE